ncbi:monocarboxylate transporter 13-like [Dermacentor albipictus]|uniref:monocarboxylate transporter 13-like n=1 Tax=Dermacentor albipictus TaxID=60249 RepID=UPI0031FE03C8
MTLPDSRACWPVAISAAIYVFVAMMLIKSESVIYIGFMDMLKVNRQDASWPLTVAIIVSQLAGPVYGILGMWMSERAMLVCGALLCALPVMICSLANSLALVVLLYGVIYGLGVACEEVLPFTVVARHFVRYRGTAMSLLFVVTAISGFVSPLITEALRQALDFRVALLVLGALQLNMLFGCIFVNRVPPSREPDCDQDDDHSTQPVTSRIRRSSFQTASFAHSCSKDLVTSFAIGAEPALGDQQSAESKPLLGKNRGAGSRLKRKLRSLFTVAFAHISASRALSVLVLASFLLTAVDFGKDNGLEGYEAVALVTAVALGDLVSRIGTGLLLDFKLMSADCLMMWGFGVQAAALATTALVKQYWLLLVSCFIVGMSGGGRIFASTVMVSERVDQDSLSLSLGVMNFIAGVVCLARPPLIGYVRDVLGCYDPLYIAFAIANAIFTVTWAASLCCETRRRSIDDRQGAIPSAQERHRVED